MDGNIKGEIEWTPSYTRSKCLFLVTQSYICSIFSNTDKFMQVIDITYIKLHFSKENWCLY